MKQIKHIGTYGLIIKEDKILLIKKHGGTYDGKLDLPGGTIEFNETIEDALVRELQEELGIEITDYKLFDIVTTNVQWNHKNEMLETKHIAILYIINEFINDIKENVEITDINDDSKGAEYYDIKKLKKEQLSNISILALEKMGYKI